MFSHSHAHVPHGVARPAPRGMLRAPMPATDHAAHMHTHHPHSFHHHQRHRHLHHHQQQQQQQQHQQYCHQQQVCHPHPPHHAYHYPSYYHHQQHRQHQQPLPRRTAPRRYPSSSATSDGYRTVMVPVRVPLESAPPAMHKLMRTPVRITPRGTRSPYRTSPIETQSPRSVPQHDNRWKATTSAELITANASSSLPSLPSSSSKVETEERAKDNAELVAANALMNLAPTKTSGAAAPSAAGSKAKRLMAAIRRRSGKSSDSPRHIRKPRVFRPIVTELAPKASVTATTVPLNDEPTYPASPSYHHPNRHCSISNSSGTTERYGTVTPSSSFESPASRRRSKAFYGDYNSDMSSIAESDACSSAATPTIMGSMLSISSDSPSLSRSSTHVGAKAEANAATSPLHCSEPSRPKSNKSKQPLVPWHNGSISLSIPEDDDVLSPLHCFMRRYCVEAFAATEQDVATPRYGKSHGVKVVIDQVGIRCLYCKHRDARDRPERAVCYPSSLRNIYHSIETWQRRHSLVCPDIAPWVKKTMAELMESSKSRAGGRRKYWEDSARRLGMDDTSSGVRFVRHPGLLPANESAMPTHAHADQVSNRPSVPVVDDEDRQLVTDYLFLLMDQMQTCYFTEEDRTGGRSKVKSNPVGFPGIMCKHCHGKAGFGRYFPTSVNALALANSDRNIYNHIQKCRRCPSDIKAELIKLSKAESPKNRRGLRKLFFQRVWNRVHGPDS